MVSKTGFPITVQPGIPKLAPLPDGWVQMPLGHYLEVVKRPANLKDDKEYDLVTVKRARGGVVRREHLLGKEISVKSQYNIEVGDFLISKRQIVHGACGIVPSYLDGSIVSNEYSVLNAKNKFELIFLKYLSESVHFQQTCFHSSIGVHIEKMIFKLDRWLKWPFNIPPVEEQKKISKILLTWDRAIEVTENLISNSRKQKKSLVQQLFTGKKRLPGFREKWKLKTIGSFCSAFSGGTPSRTKEEYYGGTIPWVTSGKVNDRFIYSVSEYITDEGLKNSSAKCIERNNILVAMYGATAGKVAINMIDGATINQAILALIPNSNCFDLFIFYLLEREMVKALNLVQGGQPNLNASIIKSIKVEIPHLKEQQKIAAVLSTADKEIETLQQKLDYLRGEKKALMQQLLTGTRRVKIDGEDISQKEVVRA